MDMMTGSLTGTAELAQEMDRLLARRGHLAPLIEAFRPLLLVREQILSGLPWDSEVIPLRVDPLSFHDGIPLIGHCGLFSPADPGRELGLEVAAAIGSGFPKWEQDMKALAKALRDGRVDLFTLFSSAMPSDEEHLQALARKLRIAPAIFAFFLQMARRIVLARRARDAASLLARLAWRKGYCPVCGAFPMLSIVPERSGRLLHCSQCGHEWPFSWAICPWCERESPEEANYIFVTDDPEEKAFICDHCKRYLLSAKRLGSAMQDGDLLAIGMAHLDVILQLKGYSPMAACPWNIFDDPDEETPPC